MSNNLRPMRQGTYSKTPVQNTPLTITADISWISSWTQIELTHCFGHPLGPTENARYRFSISEPERALGPCTSVDRSDPSEILF